MRIVVAAVGRLKAGAERELAERYRDRAAKTGRALGIRDIEVIEVRDSRAREPERRILEESIAARQRNSGRRHHRHPGRARRQRLQRVLRRPAARLERCRPRQRLLRHRRRRWPRRGAAPARRPEPRLRHCDLAPSTRANHAAGADLSGLYDPVRTSLPSRVTAAGGRMTPALALSSWRTIACLPAA